MYKKKSSIKTQLLVSISYNNKIPQPMNIQTPKKNVPALERTNKKKKTISLDKPPSLIFSTHRNTQNEPRSIEQVLARKKKKERWKKKSKWLYFSLTLSLALYQRMKKSPYEAKSKKSFTSRL